MRVEGVKPDVLGCNQALAACARAARADEAIALLGEMREDAGGGGALGGGGGGVGVDVVTYNSAANACARARRPREALALLAQMRRDGIRPDTITCARARMHGGGGRVGQLAGGERV